MDNVYINLKDIRLYINCFEKQNLNFLEILFTPYKIVNPQYADEWAKLVLNREDIAHMNPYRAVKAMKGIAMEKFHAMEHRYPSKIDIYNGNVVSYKLMKTTVEEVNLEIIDEIDFPSDKNSLENILTSAVILKKKIYRLDYKMYEKVKSNKLIKVLCEK